VSIVFIKRHSHINWTLLDQAVVSGVNFLTGLLIARFLGIEAFGVFTLVWMAVLFVSSIQMALISSPMMTIGPKQSDEDKAGYYGAVVMQQIIFSTLTSLLLWVGVVFSDLINPQWQVLHLALPLAMALFFFQNQDFLRRVFFTENRAIAALINDIISYLGRIILLVVLFFNTDLTTAGVLWIIAITSAMAVIIGWYQLNKLVFSRKKLLSVFKHHWVLSKWLIATAVLQWTSAHYFILVAGSLLGPVAVGALKAAQNIVGISNILYQGFENIVPASASRHFKNVGAKGLTQYLVKVAIFGGVANLIIAVSVSIFPEALLMFIFGEQYQGYGYILQLYALYYVVSFFSLPLRSGLRVIEMTKPIFLSYLLMSIFSLSFANIFVAYWGLEGAMIGMLVATGISVFFLAFYFASNIRQA